MTLTGGTAGFADFNLTDSILGTPGAVYDPSTGMISNTVVNDSIMVGSSSSKTVTSFTYANGTDFGDGYTLFFGLAQPPVTSPLTITSLIATLNVLWPPNHRLVPITVSAATSGGSGAASCKIASVSINEPIDADGDWLITGNLTLYLRAERNGLGNGRVYGITVRCTTGAGDSVDDTVYVNVPHDKGH